MDNIDERILFFLSENCRFTNAKIAKTLRISEQVVKYRIDRMERNKVIKKYVTLVNLKSIGSLRYAEIYLKVKRTRDEEKEKILKFLHYNPYVIGLFECEGNWNIGVVISAAFDFEIASLLNGIQEIGKHYLEDIRVFDITFHLALRKQPLFENESLKQLESSLKSTKYDSSFQKELTQFKLTYSLFIAPLDKIDIKLLTILRNDARIPLYQLANKIGVNIQTAKIHISNLIRRGVIKHFFALIDYSKFGLKIVSYFLNAFADRKRIDGLISYLRKFPASYTIIGYLDYWNIKLTFIAKDSDQIDKIFDTILFQFSDLISDYSKLIPTKWIKSESFNTNLDELYGGLVKLLNFRNVAPAKPAVRK